MSFKTTGGKFYLVPKHSKTGLVVAVEGPREGASLYLQKQDPENVFQRFTLHKVADAFYVKVDADGQSITVHNNSADSHTAQRPIPIIQWPNGMTFQLMPAGDGFYRIRAPHSGKFWDVFENRDEVNAVVVHHNWTAGDNQLFSVVPVPRQKSGMPSVSLIQSNEMMRTAVLGLIGVVPDVGKGLSFVLGLFWTEKDKLSDLWSQMQSYVEMRIKQLILEDKLDSLARGLEKQLRQIKLTEDSGEALKGESVRRHRDELIGLFADYKDRPWQVLPYLINYGTMVMNMCRMMVVSYKELFGHEPLGDVAPKNQKVLEDTLKEITNEVDKCRVEMMKWRVSQIGMATDKSSGSGYVSYSATAYDHYDGWSLTWWYSVSVGGTTGDHDYKLRADTTVKRRHEQVKVQFETEMDLMLQQAAVWQDFNPKNQPRKKEKIRKTVGAYGGPYSHRPFAGTENAQISSIIVHFYPGSHICGVEVKYDNGTNVMGGIVGTAKGELKLAADEYVSSVYGCAASLVFGLWFVTNKGNLIGGGPNNDPNCYFCADIPDGLNARLVKISGSSNNNTIEHLTFEWEYQGYPTPQPKGVIDTAAVLLATQHLEAAESAVDIEPVNEEIANN